ncbi:MAG: hypothetical protein IPH93_09015 [Saprospiraceae bacterium]|nr:hypothetical protein [Saprospiraceae bacterium]MBK7810633.1 hypothetical protein [Saprospiraceae bacterium]MBK9630225.1 hypothetical protein [Saprospiraceae bacterium]
MKINSTHFVVLIKRTLQTFLLFAVTILMTSCENKEFNWNSNSYVIKEVNFLDEIENNGKTLFAGNGEIFIELQFRLIKEGTVINPESRTFLKVIDRNGKEYDLEHYGIKGGTFKKGDGPPFYYIFGPVLKKDSPFKLQVESKTINF